MFQNLNKQLQAQFAILTAQPTLFRVNIKGEELWKIYLDSFDNPPIWRVNSIHNCDNDRHFFERYANIVAIIDNKIVTMFDFQAEKEYENSINAVATAIKASKIVSIFIESYEELQELGNAVERSKLHRNQSEYRLGNEKTLKQYLTEQEAMGKKIGEVYTFYHFNVMLPKLFVDFSSKSSSAILGDLNITRQLFEKGLNIPLETLELVRDLIQQGSLLRGDIYLPKVLEFIKLKKQYETIPTELRQNWLWLNFQSTHYARFANELIGTTCIELAEGKDINKVCKDFNIRVDPTNYNKAKSPVTKQMIELAEKTIIKLGYENSFERRFANIDDINVSEIKHSNIDNSVEKPVGLFGKAGVPTTTQFNRHKRAESDKVETVTIDKFMSDILPNSTSVEVFMENRMENNLVSLFTTKDKTAKNLFKWNNPFNWTYNGNLSGKSMIKENVKAIGGKTSGVCRFSLQWNDEDTKGIVDLDLHCQTPKMLVHYRDKRDSYTTTWLDIDMINPKEIGIENMTTDKWIVDGMYKFGIHNYSNHTNHNGFKAELEIDGEIYNYSYLQPFIGFIPVVDVTVKNGKVIDIKHNLPDSSSNKILWNIETNQFHKVSLVCTSPNYWGDNNIGTKEYFFMLQNCKSDTSMRAFHIDQLNSELMSNRKAIDLLGNYKLVEPSDSQLSGIGFNSTVRDELIVKVKGSHQRVLRIKF